MVAESTAFITFFIYIVGMIGIGVYFYLRTETKRLSDYMLAGRNVGMIPMGISQITSVASGFTFFAWVAAGFTLGLTNLWYPLFFVTAHLLLYRYVGSKFRRQSEEYDSITMVDHIAEHYKRQGRPKITNSIRILGTAIVIVFLSAYIGAQFIAVGSALDVGLGLDYTLGVVVGGIAVGIYTTLGGFNSSIWTDFVQGILVIFALFALPILAINEVGGWGTFLAEARAVDPLLLSWHGGQSPQDFLIFILGWIGISLAVIGPPHSMQRFQAVRSPRLLSGASVIATGFDMLRYVMPLFIGIAARVLYDTVENPENVAMRMVIDLFPGWLAGLVLAGIISAILSTTDSMMIVTASDVTRNVYENFVDSEASEQKSIVFGRIIVILMAAFGIVVGVIRPGTIFDIVLFAWAGLGVTLGIALFSVLFYPGVTGEGAVGGMIVGLLSAFLSQLFVPNLLYIVVWPITIAAVIGISKITRQQEPREEERGESLV